VTFVDFSDFFQNFGAAHFHVVFRADADGFVSQTDMHRVGVGFGMHGNCPDAHFPAGSVDSQSDFAAVGN